MAIEKVIFLNRDTLSARERMPLEDLINKALQDVNSLTESDKMTLRARQIYLSGDEREALADVLAEKKTKAAKDE